MRRLGDDRGAMTVMSAAIILTLIAVLVLVVDTGMIYQERRQLQNGADAAALAVAFDCARALVNPALGAACTHATALDVTAPIYADGNALDGSAAVASVGPGDLQPSTGQVTVTTLSQEDDSFTISLQFARLLGVDESQVAAQATAAWGSAAFGTGVPLTFHRDKWDAAVDEQGGLIHVENIASPPDLPDYPAPIIMLRGGDAPAGGFGWIEQDPPGSCEADAAIGQPESSTGFNFGCGPGNANSNDAFRDKYYKKIVWVPLFTACGPCSGNGAKYTLSSWAALWITGYSLGSVHIRWPQTPPPAGSPTEWEPGNDVCDTGNSSDSCIRGYVLSVPPGTGPIVPGQEGTVGTGVISVRLIN